jgi:hypothetical protein
MTEAMAPIPHGKHHDTLEGRSVIDRGGKGKGGQKR